MVHPARDREPPTPWCTPRATANPNAVVHPRATANPHAVAHPARHREPPRRGAPRAPPRTPTPWRTPRATANPHAVAHTHNPASTLRRGGLLLHTLAPERLHEIIEQLRELAAHQREVNVELFGGVGLGLLGDIRPHLEKLDPFEL